MQLQKLDATKLDLKPYYDLINSLGPKGQEVFKSGLSYDIEAVVNLQKRNSPIDVVEEGLFDPSLTLEQNIENTKFYKDSGIYNYKRILEDEKHLPESQRFYSTREASLGAAGIDLNKPVSQISSGDSSPLHFNRSIGRLVDTIQNKNANLGIYNLRFEGEALLQQLGASADTDTAKGRGHIQNALKDLFYVAPENVAPSAGIYKQYGYLTGNSEAIGRAQLGAESSFSKFRNTYFANKTSDAYVQGLDKARHDAIALGKEIAAELAKQGKTKGLLYDQQHIAKAFLAQMQETHGMAKMGVDWNLGSSIDLLLRSAVNTKELHISTMDAAAAQTLTSHMAGVLQGDAPSQGMVNLVETFAANQHTYRKEKLSTDIYDFLTGKRPAERGNLFRSMEQAPIEREAFLYRGDGTVITSASTYRPMYEGGISREQMLALRGKSQQDIEASIGQTVRRSFENQSFILPNQVDDLTSSAIGSIYTHVNKGVSGAETAAHKVSIMEGANTIIEKLGAKNVAIGIAAVGTAALVARQVLMGMKTGRTEDSTHSGFEAMNPGSPDFMGAKTPFNPESMAIASTNVKAGIRRSHPTSFGEFEVMKPHPGTAFPGGREDIVSYMGRMANKLFNILEPALTPTSKNVSYGDYISKSIRNVSDAVGVRISPILNDAPEASTTVGSYVKERFKSPMIILNNSGFDRAYNFNLVDNLDQQIDVGSHEFFALQSTLGHESGHAILGRRWFNHSRHSMAHTSLPGNEKRMVEDVGSIIHKLHGNSGDAGAFELGMLRPAAMEEIIVESASVAQAAKAYDYSLPHTSAYDMNTEAILDMGRFTDTPMGILQSHQRSDLYSEFTMNRLDAGALRSGKKDKINTIQGINPNKFDHQAGRTPFNPDSMAIAGSLLGLGGLTAALLYGKHINQFIFPTSQVWGRASKFGVASENMWSGVAEEYDEDMSADSKAIVTHGTYVHEEYQKKFLNLFPDAMDEYAVIDYENRMTGHIDLVAPIEVRPGKGPIPIPIEIKTINSKAFGGLTGPKPEHVAQSQFYLHYLSKKYKKDIPYEMFVYINRDKPDQYKVFHENRDEKLFQFYLKRYRSYQKEAKGRGLSPQELTSNVSVLKEIAKQTGSRKRLESSAGSDVTTTMNIIQSAAEGYDAKGFGINRSSSSALDFDSPHKKVWAAPSAKVAKEFVNNTSPKIRALTARPPSSILKMSGYNGKSRFGQQAKYGGKQVRSRAVNQSRAGV